jgi:hypothetical protein
MQMEERSLPSTNLLSQPRSLPRFLDSTAISPHLPIPSRPQPLPKFGAQFNSPLQVGIEFQGLIEGIERVLRATGFVGDSPQVGMGES